jgi:hemolysin type calcium-binding protein
MVQIILLPLLLAAIFAGTAEASTIGSDGAVLTYEAAPHERNSVLVSVSPYDTTCAPVASPCMTVFESGARITQASGGCVVNSSGIGGDTAACPVPQRVTALLGDLDDSYWDWDGPSTIDAGPGNDNPVFGKAGDDVIAGGPGSDLLMGSEGDDRIDGGPGNDYLEGIPNGDPDPTFTSGSDTYTGGGDLDQITYENRGDDLSISLDDVANDGAAGEGDNVAGDIRVVYGGGGADTLTGNDGRNDLAGAGGDDVLAGAGGDDQLAGGLGNDLLAGNDGADTLQGDDGDDEIVGGAGADRFWGDDALGCIALSCTSGQDHIVSRDGITEPVNCGPGEDAVVIDATDYNPSTSEDACEQIDADGAAAGPGGAGPAGGGAANPPGRADAAFRVIGASVDRRGRIVVRTAAPGPGKLVARATARARKRIVVARGARAVGAAGEVVLTLKATRAARRTLRTRRRLKVGVRTVFTPRGGGAPTTVASTVSLRGSR